jgi:hypothetical protein
MEHEERESFLIRLPEPVATLFRRLSQERAREAGARPSLSRTVERLVVEEHERTREASRAE